MLPDILKDAVSLEVTALTTRCDLERPEEEKRFTTHAIYRGGWAVAAGLSQEDAERDVLQLIRKQRSEAAAQAAAFALETQQRAEAEAAKAKAEADALKVKAEAAFLAEAKGVEAAAGTPADTVPAPDAPVAK